MITVNCDRCGTPISETDDHHKVLGKRADHETDDAHEMGDVCSRCRSDTLHFVNEWYNTQTTKHELTPPAP